MPELPEVEATRRLLAPVLEGRTLVDIELRHPRTGRRNHRPADVPDRLAGRTVGTMGRTGKFIITGVSGDLNWVIHLGMSGRMQIAQSGEPEQPHTHFVARTERGDEVRLVDPRTFGFVAVLTDDEFAESPLGSLGPDAYTALPSARVLAGQLEGRNVAIKTLMLDQRFLAGLGNIYVDEVLWRANVRPDRRSNTLSDDEVRAIRRAIRPVLADGLRHGGTSLDDLAYLLPDGRTGEYTRRLRVYGRDGEPCRRCGSVIERIVLAARSAHFCPTCQR